MLSASDITASAFERESTFECDLQGKAECFFLFDSLIRVVALVNQPAGLVNDVRAVDRHRPTRSIHINGFLVIFFCLFVCFFFLTAQLLCKGARH